MHDYKSIKAAAKGIILTRSGIRLADPDQAIADSRQKMLALVKRIFALQEARTK